MILPSQPSGCVTGDFCSFEVHVKMTAAPLFFFEAISTNRDDDALQFSYELVYREWRCERSFFHVFPHLFPGTYPGPWYTHTCTLKYPGKV